MVAQYKWRKSLNEIRIALKRAYSELLIEYGNHDDARKYSLDITKFGSVQWIYIPCHKIIRSGCEIYFEGYDDDGQIEFTYFEQYKIEILGEFYDALVTAMNKQEKK